MNIFFHIHITIKADFAYFYNSPNLKALTTDPERAMVHARDTLLHAFGTEASKIRSAHTVEYQWLRSGTIIPSTWSKNPLDTV